MNAHSLLVHRLRSRGLLRHACVLATLIVAALLVADGVTSLLAAGVLGAITAQSSREPRVALPTTLSGEAAGGRDAARAILARNIFDPQTGALWPPRPPAPPPAEPAPEPITTDGRCDIGIRVAAAFYDDRRPERSWVVLRGELAGGTRTFMAGMSIGERLVADIEPEAVRLSEPNGRGCWLSMFTPQSREKIAAERDTERERTGRARKRDKGPPFSPDELQAGIRPLGKHSYAVRRHVVAKARAHAAYISKTTRVAPTRGKDRGLGLRIARLRKGGLLTHLGLRRGDVVRSINGVAANDTGTLLTAYAALDRANRISLAITRKRESLVLEYYVQ